MAYKYSGMPFGMLFNFSDLLMPTVEGVKTFD